MKVIFCLFFLLTIITGCKKDIQNHPYSKIQLPFAGTIRDITIINLSTWIICGGDNASGKILKTTNSGLTWNTSSTFFNTPVNCLYFLNQDTGFAGDADIIIYKTIDGGQNWNAFLDDSWPLTINRNLRDIWFINDTTGFVCGGKNLGNGVLYNTTNGGVEWNYREFNHEYRGICFIDNENGIMCGHGSLLTTRNGGASFEISNQNKLYFTGIALNELNQYWVCDFNGTIMNSSDKGQSWKESRNGSAWEFKGGQLNCIDTSPEGRIVCAGPAGFFTWSDDNGSSWNDRKCFGGTDILSIKWISANEVVAAGKNGQFFHIIL